MDFPEITGRCGCGLRTAKHFPNFRISKPTTSSGNCCQNGACQGTPTDQHETPAPITPAPTEPQPTSKPTEPQPTSLPITRPPNYVAMVSAYYASWQVRTLYIAFLHINRQKSAHTIPLPTQFLFSGMIGQSLQHLATWTSRRSIVLTSLSFKQTPMGIFGE